MRIRKLYDKMMRLRNRIKQHDGVPPRRLLNAYARACKRYAKACSSTSSPKAVA